MASLDALVEMAVTSHPMAAAILMPIMPSPPMPPSRAR